MIIPTLKLPTNLQIFSTTDTPPLICNPHNTTKLKPIKISASSSSSLLAQEPSSILDKDDDDDDDGAQVIEKIRVVVRPMERPRLVLKFIWMEKNIGIAIDQVIPGGRGTIPLSPYYFWPRKDAWEELKVMLERNPWISRKQVVVLLNQATDIIHLWQQAGGGVD